MSSAAPAAKPSVVVIGGTGGIGHAIAEFYAKRGSKVVITGRDAERTAASAREIGDNVRGIALDVAEPETIEKSLKDIGHVDHLALVAVERDYNSAREYDIARARRIVTMKLIGYTEVAHTLYPRMGAGASAVLFGGLASERPYPGSTSITTVNGAVSSLIRTLAVELAPVRFNAIHPGIISDSPAWRDKHEAIANIEKRTPGGRLATTNDVVHSVDFLFTNRGVNGINLVIDGGWLLT
jgi:NAD(P)-dependent dehydrogenase (short-subunit alcohol dehydrogenase family)